MEQQAVIFGTLSSSALTVKKRNGQQVPFFEVRILRAVENACKAHLGIPIEAGLDPAWQAATGQVTQKVVEWCQLQAATQPVLFIEDIQDAVIAQLRIAGLPEVAQCYSSYRKQQERKRFETQRLTVQKRDGRSVSFKPEKIAIAIGKAFAAASPGTPLSAQTQQMVLDLAEQVIARLKNESTGLRTVAIEEIQDLVEQMLMQNGHHEVARRYILYRQEHARLRQEPPAAVPLTFSEQFTIRQADGTAIRLDLETLKLFIAEVCRGLEDAVSVESILRGAVSNCFDGMHYTQLHEAILFAVRALIESEPAYSFVAARLLLRQLYAQVMGHAVSFEAMQAEYPTAFKQSIEMAAAAKRLSPALLAFDLDSLGAALKPERDFQFGYMGLQTLYDRYFIHVEGRRLETPQGFWMRVAMGLALGEGLQKNERAIAFYEVMSRFLYIPSTPTLFNAGTLHPQLSSCFLTTVGDDLDNIFECIKDNALLSKWSGGLGNDWTPVRAMGSLIRGTNGKSQGVVPFMKVANDTAVAVNQGGKRQGAVCAYLEVWHLDIEEFLELRKNTGDDRRRTHDMHTANWIPDLFMKRMLADGDWMLFSPNETPDLHDLYGQAFEKRYEAYERMAEAGKLRQWKKVSAVALWRKMLAMLFETGHPWITFKDPSNIRSPQDHCGVVHSSNLCTEILLNTSREETAVCNLGSINLAAHASPAGLELEQLAQTVRTAVRMLDNVIDLNYYPTPEARTANLRHRPVGLGLMGFQDALYALGISYGSPQAVAFADESMEALSYYAILASSELAKERGTYESHKGSKWERGLLPIDTVQLLRQERGGYVDVDLTCRMDWALVRESVRQYGMRNSNVLAIAPTATIANIIGVNQSVEPAYKNLYVKSNLSGEFTIVNPALVEELKALGLWDAQMIQDLKYFDGSVQEIGRIPQPFKDRYSTAFEVGFEWVIGCASRRQKWIDMGQSLNLYLAEPSGKKMHAMYRMAWEKGLKTTYYLRSLGATRIEKSTLDVNRYGNPLGQKWKGPQAASCGVGDKSECEACQ